MILTIDIGNTTSKLGWFEGERLVKTHRVETPSLTGHIQSQDLAALEQLAVASVVPEVCEALLASLDGRIECAPFVLSHEMILPFEMAYRTPETLGNDRIAAAVAAWTHYRVEGRPMIAIDAGTAVTTEVISEAGIYRGGSIAPGPSLLDKALHDGTAQLPRVKEELPESPIGGSTSEAIRAGIMFGFIDAVAGIVSRTTTELGCEPVVVATGGWALLLSGHIEAIDTVDSHLVLRGALSSMRLNSR